jgi:hypothetical protein
MDHRAMDQHPLGVRQPVKHACPECPIGQAGPFCVTCWGTGLVTEEDLFRWQAGQNRIAAGIA